MKLTAQNPSSLLRGIAVGFIQGSVFWCGENSAPYTAFLGISASAGIACLHAWGLLLLTQVF